MVLAYSAIANGGMLMEPRIIDRIEYESGIVERFDSRSIRRVITNRTASLMSGMLVSVVDSGHAGGAIVPGYYIAGKTGTAQIAGEGGYSDETNHTFVGYGPVSDPKFVMLVKFEKPQRRFSASTAAPVFGDIAAFLVQYYQIPPSR
jgi:cell division protein FtsI/penicillin-binding protein 2